MTDLELIKRCAEKMGLDVIQCPDFEGWWFNGRNDEEYNPLTDDAQAMALVKRFRLDIASGSKSATLWAVMLGANQCVDHDLNRAIVRCVSVMCGENDER